MVVVYQPDLDERYQWAIPIEKHGYLGIQQMINQRHGAPIGGAWVPARVFLLEDHEGGSPLRKADMPLFTASELVVTRRAKEALEKTIGADAEMLPLLNDVEDLWLVNAWRVVDALDEENSEVKRFASSGRIMRNNAVRVQGGNAARNILL
jgi:Immunity protein family (Imm11)